MSLFTDQLLLQLSDPAQLAQTLAPASDPTHARVRALLSAAYELPHARLHEVLSVEARQIEAQRLISLSSRTVGTWTQTTPSYTRTDIFYERPAEQPPLWIDLAAELALTVVLESDPGEIESIVTQPVANFTTLDEFRAHFEFIDLDAFMAEHRISSVEELRERFSYLRTEIRLRALAAFNPDDPANQRRYRLNLAILIRETIDVLAALRAAKQLRAAIERTLVAAPAQGEAELRTPYAPLLIFPEAALAGLPHTAAELRAFFARENVLALFLTPT
jgi:hypothetical protein